MHVPIDHRYSNFKNKNLFWVDTDSEESFNHHMSDPERRAQLIKYGWDNPTAITYQFNSHGFRSKEFDDSPGIIALGCSFTAGIGLPQNSIWPELVGQQLGLSVWNLGIGGASMDTCFRNLYHYVDKLNAEYVLLLAPPEQRFELHTDEKILCFRPQHVYHPIQQWWYQCEINGQLNFYKNLLAIQQLCSNHNKKLIVKNIETDLFGLPHTDKWPTSRDMLHVGAQEQKKCANQFIDSIKTDLANL
jgi:hypothetical protein